MEPVIPVPTSMPKRKLKCLPTRTEYILLYCADYFMRCVLLLLPHPNHCCHSNYYFNTNNEDASTTVLLLLYYCEYYCTSTKTARIPGTRYALSVPFKCPIAPILFSLRLKTQDRPMPRLGCPNRQWYCIPRQTCSRCSTICTVSGDHSKQDLRQTQKLPYITYFY